MESSPANLTASRPDRRLVTARVPLGPVPLAPPPAVAPYVRAERRPGVDTPTDWVLDPTRFAAAAPTDDMSHIAASFAAWRRNWMSTFALDEVAEVQRFGTVADENEFPLLGRLSTAAAFYAPEELEDLDVEAATITVALERIRTVAWRFTDTISGAQLRVVSAPGRLMGDTAEDWEIVAVAGRGIRLRLAVDVHDVAGWSLAETGVVVTLGGVDAGELVLRGAPARALAQLAPSSPRVAVDPVPAAEAWAPLVTSITSAVTTAALAEAAVLVTPEGQPAP